MVLVLQDYAFVGSISHYSVSNLDSLYIRGRLCSLRHFALIWSTQMRPVGSFRSLQWVKVHPTARCHSLAVQAVAADSSFQAKSLLLLTPQDVVTNAPPLVLSAIPGCAHPSFNPCLAPTVPHQYLIMTPNCFRITAVHGVRSTQVEAPPCGTPIKYVIRLIGAYSLANINAVLGLIHG